MNGVEFGKFSYIYTSGRKVSKVIGVVNQVTNGGGGGGGGGGFNFMLLKMQIFPKQFRCQKFT